MPAESHPPTQSNSPVEIKFTPEFKRNLRALAKKYRHIRSDVHPILEQLQTGKFVGEQVPRTGYTIYKVRIRNRDLQKGKRAGYRLIYYLQTSSLVVLITIYSKTEQADIAPAQIRRIVRDFNE